MIDDIRNWGNAVLLESRLGGCDGPRPSQRGTGMILMGNPVLRGRARREVELRGSTSTSGGGNPCLLYSMVTASTCSVCSKVHGT